MWVWYFGARCDVTDNGALTIWNMHHVSGSWQSSDRGSCVIISSYIFQLQTQRSTGLLVNEKKEQCAFDMSVRASISRKMTPWLFTLCNRLLDRESHQIGEAALFVHHNYIYFSSKNSDVRVRWFERKKSSDRLTCWCALRCHGKGRFL